MGLYHHLPSLAVFAIAAAFTPGPNNVLLMASGANFGFRRTVPHLLGTMLGFLIALAGFAFGLGVVFMLVTAGAATTWTGFGTAMGALLKSDGAYRAFNRVMALLTASAVALLFV